MADTMLINSQAPPRAPALEPLGRPFHYATRYEIIAFASIVDVLVECRDDHSFMKLHYFPDLVFGGVSVREAEQLSEETIEIRSQSDIAHATTSYGICVGP
jgi:hypothetical protein